jgi:ribosomal protein S21|tara:strand:- start:636 stop:893 length:258 start_codon:yes stop_codon:yes gene_type:complete
MGGNEMSSINVKVTARECRNNNERMIRKFNKKVKKERIIEQVKDRRRYKKPSVRKKEKRARALRARQRDQLKKQRALERRSRNKK